MTFLFVKRKPPWVAKHTKVSFQRTWGLTCSTFPGGNLIWTLEESFDTICKAKEILKEAKGWYLSPPQFSIQRGHLWVDSDGHEKHPRADSQFETDSHLTHACSAVCDRSAFPYTLDDTIVSILTSSQESQSEKT